MEASTSSFHHVNCCVCHCRLELHDSLKENKDLESGADDDPVLLAIQVTFSKLQGSIVVLDKFTKKVTNLSAFLVNLSLITFQVPTCWFFPFCEA